MSRKTDECKPLDEGRGEVGYNDEDDVANDANYVSGGARSLRWLVWPNIDGATRAKIVQQCPRVRLVAPPADVSAAAAAGAYTRPLFGSTRAFFGIRVHLGIVQGVFRKCEGVLRSIRGCLGCVLCQQRLRLR